VIELSREGNVFVLTMQSGENRFNRSFVEGFGSALDEVEAVTGSVALVTIGGTEKFYSNGLDLDWLQGEGRSEFGIFVERVIDLLARFVALPIPTVAALNGHCFAAGAMLALAHDYRVMRADRGYFCLNEVDIGLPLHPGMQALISARLNGRALRDCVLAGTRFGGADALDREIVDSAVSGDQVRAVALERAQALAAKDRATFAALKTGLVKNLAAEMRAGLTQLYPSKS
jgi:Delta3-Delta2-enoyl-CoA isomerase